MEKWQWKEMPGDEHLVEVINKYGGYSADNPAAVYLGDGKMRVRLVDTLEEVFDLPE